MDVLGQGDEIIENGFRSTAIAAIACQLTPLISMKDRLRVGVGFPSVGLFPISEKENHSMLFFGVEQLTISADGLDQAKQALSMLESIRAAL